MVTYICNRCGKYFNKKNKFDKHLNRTYMCQINKNHKKDVDEYFCNVCNKKYARQDTMNRHLKSKKHEINMKTYKKVKKINIINGDTMNVNNNNINNGDMIINNNKNYYFISPFGQEETKKLTSLEKISTLLSQENPIIEIILITNLNPKKPEYHNIGYTDIKSGYGIIFNGKTWERKEVNAMFNELLMTKKNDLFKIRLEISPFLSDEHKKIIEEKLQNVQNNVEPKLEHHIKSKNKLVTNIKTHFVNGRSIVKEAIKKSGVPIEKIPNEHPDSWIDEYDFDDIDKQLELINSKKESARDMLKIINHIDHQILSKIIDEARTLDEISVIIRLITKSYYFKNNINEDTVKKQMQNEVIMNKILFGKQD